MTTEQAHGVDKRSTVAQGSVDRVVKYVAVLRNTRMGHPRKMELLELALVEETNTDLKALIEDPLADDCNLPDLQSLLEDPSLDE